MTGAQVAADDALGQLAHIEELLAQRDDLMGLLDREAVLRLTSRRVRTDLHLDLGYTSVLEDEDLLVIRGCSGAKSSALRGLEVPRGLGLGGKSFAMAAPVWVPDYCSASSITHHFDTVIRKEGIGAMVAVPLLHEGEVLGVVYGAQRFEAELGDAAITALEAIASPAAKAIRLADRARVQTEVALCAERRKIAVSLHDSVGAMLFMIGAELRTMQDDAGTDPELQLRLQVVEQRIAETAAVFRESLAVLDDIAPQQALTATVRGDCEAFSSRTGVPARCLALNEIPDLQDSQRSALVGLVREALLNVDKHADAGSVVVTICTLDGHVTLAVADDGVGWARAAEVTFGDRKSADRTPSDRSSGLGLQAAFDRLAQVGGGMSVVGNEDGGLTVRAWVPAG